MLNTLWEACVSALFCVPGCTVAEACAPDSTSLKKRVMWALYVCKSKEETEKEMLLGKMTMKR